MITKLSLIFGKPFSGVRFSKYN